MSEAPALPLFAESGVKIAPVPTELVVARLTIDGRQVVGLQATTPSGVAFYFLDVDQAKKVGEVLQSVASGIIISPSLLANRPAGQI